MEQSGSWYRDWFDSPYYHQLYSKRNDTEAASFISHLIEHLKPEAGSLILDIACGNGRHSIQLADMGFDVTGIDLSENNIKKAKKKESDHLHFFLHDMRLPFWINYFDYAFNFFTSFGYFNTRRENDNVLRTISQSLKVGGIFVIDYLNPDYEESHLVAHSEKDIKDAHFHITKWHDDTHFHKKIVVEDKNLKAPLEFREMVSKFSLDDFAEMFSNQKMQILKVFGDYHFGNYHLKDSPRMIIIAGKMPS